MPSITIDEREIPLAFTMSAWAGSEQAELDPVGDLRSVLVDGPLPITNLITLVEILGNAGLRRAHKHADLTWEWIGDHMWPHQRKEAVEAITGAVSEGFRMETKDSDEAYDAALAEIEKKEGPDA